MYVPDTILKLKKQKPAEKIKERTDPDTGRVRKAHSVPFPYNRVRVVGQSPVAHPASEPGVIIEPLSYHGGTLDEPLSKIQRLYDVESEPSNEIIIEPVKVIRLATNDVGPSPEDIFAKEGGGTPPEPGQQRARTSPLDDDGAPIQSTSPLDDD